MSKSASFLFVLAVATCFGCDVKAQQLTPPLVGDIAVDRNDVAPLEEVKKLIAAGRSKQALAFADDQLVKNPRNAQMRFVRGVILSDMNDNDAARAASSSSPRIFLSFQSPITTWRCCMRRRASSIRHAQRLNSHCWRGRTTRPRTKTWAMSTCRWPLMRTSERQHCSQGTVPFPTSLRLRARWSPRCARRAEH